MLGEQPFLKERPPSEAQNVEDNGTRARTVEKEADDHIRDTLTRLRALKAFLEDLYTEKSDRLSKLQAKQLEQFRSLQAKQRPRKTPPQSKGRKGPSPLPELAPPADADILAAAPWLVFSDDFAAHPEHLAFLRELGIFEAGGSLHTLVHGIDHRIAKLEFERSTLRARERIVSLGNSLIRVTAPRATEGRVLR